jgi:hypothetical protein
MSLADWLNGGYFLRKMKSDAELSLPPPDEPTKSFAVLDA